MIAAAFQRKDALNALTWLSWEEGREYFLIEGPYRHTLVVLCSEQGRQKAKFADGEEHNYSCYLRFERGANLVPVLPDGRLLMVVEQRQAQGNLTTRPKILELAGGKTIDLETFGPYSSLEFPGGGIDPGETITIGLLRELKEETLGGSDQSPAQKATLYRMRHPIFPFGSDTTANNVLAVVFLSNNYHAEHVTNDGGLHIFALEPNEVRRNIENGVIASGQAGLLPWWFYGEVMKSLQQPFSPLMVKEEVWIS